MGHYYTNDETLKDEKKLIEIEVRGIKLFFYTNSGVFSKNGLDFGSKLLIETIVVSKSVEKIIEIGSGYGPIGLYTAKTNPDKKIYMVDINERAVLLSRENALINGISNASISVGNILEGIDTKFDLAITNPPIRAGKKVVFEIYKQTHEHLNSGGMFYVVIQKKQGAESSFKKLQELFEKVSIIEKKNGYHIILCKKS